MQVQATDLRVGDIIQEKGWRGTTVRQPVEIIRRGGHISKAGLSSTPKRLARYADIIINESWVYCPTAIVTVLRDGGKIEEVGSGG